MTRVIPFTLMLPFGCSLITPLDFVGEHVGNGGTGGDLPAFGGGGTGAVGAGGLSGGTSGTGGTDEPVPGGAGSGGENPDPTGGSAGSAGSAEAGSGGTSSEGGSAGAGAGSGGEGGCGQATCCSEGTLACGAECADVTSDPAHCGGCDIACDEGVVCEKGKCISAPCVGICDEPTVLTAGEDGFRVENMGTAARCFQVVGYAPEREMPEFICWEGGQRTIGLNGEPSTCNNAGIELPAERGGGYCVQIGEGMPQWTGIRFPLP